MQKFYELVVLLHPQLSKDDQGAIYAKIDSLIGAGKKQTDDLGLIQLAHSIGKGKLQQVHLTSYYCELDPSVMPAIKKELSITKGVVRHMFFAMTAKDPFVLYKDVNKKFEKVVAVVDESAPAAPAVTTKEKKKELLVRKGYFNKEAHQLEISWKAVKLLTFYITRFGDIKPRRFMGNSVSQQKQIRQAILRAREIGLIAYAN
ncbi:MAG: 30S ribosomal protein S6 [bacterium]